MLDGEIAHLQAHRQLMPARGCCVASSTWRRDAVGESGLRPYTNSRGWWAAMVAVGLLVAGCSGSGPGNAAPGESPDVASNPPSTQSYIPVEPIAHGCHPPPGLSKGDVKVRCHSYVVDATSQMRLLEQLTHRSPYRPYRGSTQSFISYRYDYASSSEGCAITRPTVAARIVFTMPRWKPKGRPDSFLVFEWNRFIEALWIHERGHALRDLAAKRGVERILRNLGVSPTCDELRASAKRAFDQVISKLRARNRAYDRKTDHGATQGATIG